MKFRSIQWIGIVGLFLGILLKEEASGKGFFYLSLDRTASRPSPHQTAGPLRVSSRPKLARIPNLNVYYAPGVRYNLYMIDKIWYLLHNEKWYRGETHEGPWHYLSYSKVPEKLKKIPAEFIKKQEAAPPQKKTTLKKKSSKTPPKKIPSKSEKKSE